MRVRLFAATFAALLTPTHVSAALTPMAPMAPTGPWNVEFADKLCVLSRPYAVGGKKFTLGIKGELVGRFHEIMIVRAQDRPVSHGRSEAHIVKPGGAKVGPFYARTYATEGGNLISRFRVDPDKYRLTEDGDHLALNISKEGAFDFQVHALGKALAVLDGCIRDLRKEYKIDQVVIDRVAIEPKKINAVFHTSDYPLGALKIGGQGDVGTVLWIDESGRVDDCIVIENSGVESLDKATCPLLLQRARYEPARDAKGQKFRAPAYYRFSWQLPD